MSVWKKFGDFLKGSTGQPTHTTNDENVSGQQKVEKLANLSKVLTIENIEVNQKATSKNEVLKQIAKLAHASNQKIDPEAIYGRLLLREKECPTDIGDEIAVPHVADKSVDELTMLVLKYDESIEWGVNQSVNTILIFLYPDPEKNYQHISYLSTVANLLMQPNFSNDLRKADSKEAILKLFSRENTRKSR